MSNIFSIQGHGSFNPLTFIVPDGCIVIVKAHPGEPTVFGTIDRTLDKMTHYDSLVQRVCTVDEECLRNPLAHIADLIDTFGSLAFYSAGDVCPDFSYTLLSYFPDIQRFSNFGSGVVDLFKMRLLLACDMRQTDPSTKMSSYSISTFDDACDIIANLFTNSVIPTKRDILRILHEDPQYFEDVKFAFNERGLMQSILNGILLKPKLSPFVVSHVLLRLCDRLSRRAVNIS